MVYPVNNGVGNTGIRARAAQHALKLTAVKTRTYCFRMKKPNVVIALAAIFSLNACAQQPQQDASAPSQYVEALVPAWAQTLRVNVKARRAYVQASGGEMISVSRNGTDIGNGLTATRDKGDLYVRDGNGIQCNWNRRQALDWCRERNQAYNMYLNAKANLRF